MLRNIPLAQQITHYDGAYLAINAQLQKLQTMDNEQMYVPYEVHGGNDYPKTIFTVHTNYEFIEINGQQQQAINLMTDEMIENANPLEEFQYQD